MIVIHNHAVIISENTASKSKNVNVILAGIILWMNFQSFDKRIWY